MGISIIIPTYNRPNQLRSILSDIMCQSRLPDEVIVVDDSDDSKTENIVSQLSHKFSKKDVSLKYVRNTSDKSLPAARNLGVSHANCEIVMFLDDDVMLDDKYIEKILDVYKCHPKAKGVQGYIEMGNISRLANLVGKVFFLSHMIENKWEMLPSGEELFPYPLTRIINCPRLSGANQSYRRVVFEGSSFDENLKRYAFAEDKDFSYRIHKRFPNSLYATPYARLIHKRSETSRLPEKIRIYMETTYELYLHYKHFPQTLQNKLIFTWSRIGKITTAIGGSMISREARKERLYILSLLGSYLYALRHHGEIRRGDLSFLNRKLTA